MRKTTALLIAAALTAVAVVAPAGATVREKFRLHEEWAFTEDCGFPVEVTGEADNLFVLREGKNKDAGAFPVLNRFVYTETWTNPANGEFFTISGHVTFNEAKTRRVDGSIFEFTAVEAGQPFTVRDSDGSVVERNSGSVHVRYLFDTGGDTEPGGEWLEDLDVQINGPHPSLFKHPCEYAAELLA